MNATTNELVPAIPIAIAFRFMCPDKACARIDPIMSPEGSPTWDWRPATITCPTCMQTFRVSRRIDT